MEEQREDFEGTSNQRNWIPENFVASALPIAAILEHLTPHETPLLRSQTLSDQNNQRYNITQFSNSQQHQHIWTRTIYD